MLHKMSDWDEDSIYIKRVRCSIGEHESTATFLESVSNLAFWELR